VENASAEETRIQTSHALRRHLGVHIVELGKSRSRRIALKITEVIAEMLRNKLTICIKRKTLPIPAERN
jgi:hypothetical protein